jgi:hypothetical protein
MTSPNEDEARPKLTTLSVEDFHWFIERMAAQQDIASEAIQFIKLAVFEGCILAFAPDGRILKMWGGADKRGLAGNFIKDHLEESKQSMLLFRSGKPRLFIDNKHRLRVLAGRNGFAFENDEGEIEFVPTEEICATMYISNSLPDSGQTNES